MTFPTAERISLRDPAALCCAVPYLLGFHPNDSAVLLWLSEGRILLVQRIDLPGADELHDWSTSVWTHDAAARADEIVAVLVPEASLPDASLPEMEQLPRALMDAAAEVQKQAELRRLGIRDVIVLSGSRWRSLLCRDPCCCPPEGQVIDESVRLEIASRFALEGLAPQPSRQKVLESLASDPAAVEGVLSTGILDRVHHPRNRERWRDECLRNTLDWWSSAAADDRPGRRAQVLLGLRDVRVRDTLLWELCHLDGRALMTAQGQLAHLLRSAPPSDAAPIATMLSACAWLNGDGVRARIAVERALECDPHYGLAHLLGSAVAHGLPPSEWRSLVLGIGRQVCRYGDADAPEPATTEQSTRGGEAA